MVYSLFLIVLFLGMVFFLLLQELHEVDTGRFWSGGGREFGGRELCVDHGIDEPRQTLCVSLKVNLHRGEIERIETRFAGLSSEMGRSLVEMTAQQKGRVATHQSMQAIEEQTAQIRRGRKLADVFDISLPA